MVVAAPPVTTAAGRTLRFVLLVTVSLLVAHDAVYLARHGSGSGLAAAMTDGGHDGYWSWFTLMAAASVTLLGTLALRRMALLVPSRGLRAVPKPRKASVDRYPTEVVRLARALVPAVVCAFVLQENLEHLLSHGEFPGMAVLAGPDGAIAVPVLLAVSVLAAAVGALVRWQIAILEARPGGSGQPVRSGCRPATRQPGDWWIAAALCARRWILSRGDTGRAPPLGSPS